MFEQVLSSDLVARVCGQLTPGGVVKLSGVWGSSAPMLAGAIARNTNRPVLIVAPHLDEADAAADDLETLAGIAAETFPAWELEVPRAEPFDQEGLVADHVSDEVAGERLRLVSLLEERILNAEGAEELRGKKTKGKTGEEGAKGIARKVAEKSAKPTHGAPPVIVTSIAALLQPVPSPEVLKASRLVLPRGAEMPIEGLLGWLVEAGFDSVEAVEQAGEFSHRGGIVDVFQPGLSQPVRIEFFGDRIESIRRFDLDSQRSTETMEACELAAVSAGRLSDPDQTTHLLDYLGERAVVILIEPVEIVSLAGTFYTRLGQAGGIFKPEVIFKAMRALACVEMYAFGPSGGEKEEEKNAGETPATPTAEKAVPPAPEHALPQTARKGMAPEGAGKMPATREEDMGKMPATREEDMGKMPATREEDTGKMPMPLTGKMPVPREEYIPAGIRSLQRLEANTAEALDELERLSRANRVWVYCENAAERDRFLEVLAGSHAELAGRVRTAIGHIHRGFFWTSEKLVVVGHHEVFHRYAPPRRLRRIRAGRPIDSFVDLQDGDYVVHVSHGIARFEGLRTLEKEGRKEEYLTLKFAQGALLHVPVGQINLVQKYIGARRGHPTLSHLGGGAWALRKKKVAEAVHDMAAELLRIQAIRTSSQGLAYPGGTPWEERFEGEFPYEETEDQLSAMKQIQGDMALPRPMDRLLCGDVGYGKTELAMRAAFRAVEAGKQVAVLVPTTVLAAQHFRTFRERFADYPFNIEVISRFRTKQEQQDITRRAASGQVDILIGTHRLLSADVSFADLGLVIVDEEQRFGVEHKERLKRMRATVDILTMTATPIPRTLHMALLGLRDISNLTTAPLDRRAIYTEVCAARDDRLRAAILRELARGGQIFFVHNRVQSIDGVAEHLRKLVPEARVAIGHGQMAERQLESVMLKFVRGQTDVLVCTTIVESGLDIPTANTMFIHDADRFGLAQLHQLRGRIGRYKHRAYCYLLLPKHRSVNLVAAKRLKAVEEFSDLGAGFQIAMRDLEIRGAGNILGSEQSGHIAAVGYELYCRLLEQAVGQLRGERPKVRRQVHVEVGLEAYIPRAYVASGRQRMEIYRRLALAEGLDELERLSSDLADAYGKIPPTVESLLAVAQARLCAGQLGISSIIVMPPDVVFTVDSPRHARCLEGLAGTLRMPDARTAHWRPPPAYLEQPTLIHILRRHFLQAVGQV